MTTAELKSDPVTLTIYWMPGCSSCLRMKEFVKSMGIPHVAVNATEEPESNELLARMGLAVPAAVWGKAGVAGVDLAGVARLAGIEYKPPDVLAPAVCFTRYGRVMDVAEVLVSELSPENLDHREADRARTMRQLAVHISTIMRGFVDIEDTNRFSSGTEYMTPELISDSTVAEILDVAEDTRARLADWWHLIGSTDTFDRVVEGKNGTTWTLEGAFERAVWHTTQHVRQLQFFVEHRFGKEPPDRLTDDDLEGLPLPEGINAEGDE